MKYSFNDESNSKPDAFDKIIDFSDIKRREVNLASKPTTNASRSPRGRPTAGALRQSISPINKFTDQTSKYPTNPNL